MRDRTVAIIGATGQLGRALTAALPPLGWDVRPLGHDDVEIADRASIGRALDPAPSVVINTAFWPGEALEPAFRVNAFGPRLLAEFCAAQGTLLVHLSTDYVFDGDANEPYHESDPTRPRSIYGLSKATGEQLVRTAAPRHLIVRVSSLLGHGGSRAKQGTNFITSLLERAERGGPVRVVADQLHSPTFAMDAAVAIGELLKHDVFGTVHVSNRGWCSWYELAVKLFQFAGVTVPVAPIRLADLPSDGPPRPRYTVLGHYALHVAGIASPPPWEEGLQSYLAVARAERVQNR